ncbi:hypothetical protein D1224_02530 [Henriciella barbarensis]|uniref:TipN n=1 Tax=Henriciella barbarensis TaxID=86342 RepID=A0A399R437_9PROT|nr:hypothetical protein [Henriciella barbarensis]RIJ26010.1 hypothetical protein D1224_02530 [Henriciella barbarensis]
MAEQDNPERDELRLSNPVPMAFERSPASEVEALNAAREEGKVFVWIAIGTAVLWWVAAFSGVYAYLGSAGISQLPIVSVIAGAVALFLPGLLVLLAGFLARSNARASAANSVVLEAAARLIAPIETSGREAQSFAGLMKTSAGEVDRAMAHALSSMKAMSGEISEERTRLETVSHETAKQAKDLSERLNAERSALQLLAEQIESQSKLMSEAIPRQAEHMQASAKQAAEDIAEADAGLETRLNELREAGATLSDRVAALDEMAVAATKRSESLIFAVSRMEEKLEQSRRMVDQALRASEMVAASASTTGDRITEAVSAAMENAKTASRDIQMEAREAAERAAESLATLKRAGEEAAAAVREARKDADELARLQVSVERTSHDTAAAEAEAKAPVSTPDPYSDDDDVFENEGSSTNVAPASSRNENDSDLFGGNGNSSSPSEADHSDTEAEDADEASAEDKSVARRRWKDRMPPYLKPVAGGEAQKLDEAGLDEKAEPFAPTSAIERREDRNEPSDTGRRERWSSILADVARDERPHLPREENAEEMIHRLMESGIRLTDTFRPRDKKKIAAAARKGEGVRRKSVVDAASRQVQRVQKRLDSDSDLMMMAREFLAVEEADALSALDKTSHSSRNASARLSAFLLIDAALG